MQHVASDTRDDIDLLAARPVWRTDVPRLMMSATAPFGSVTHYTVRDADGNDIAIHVRTDLPGGTKTFTWKTSDGRLGLNGLSVNDLPPWGLERVDPDSTLFVTEGEKPAASLIERGYNAVGWAGGASSRPSGTALACISGHTDIVLWPDNDEPGQAFMARIHRDLTALGATRIRHISWPDAPSHGDAADFDGDPTTLIEPEPVHPAKNLFRPIDEIHAEPFEDVFAIQDWIRQNTLIAVCAPEGVGKSYLSRQIGIHAAIGQGELLGQYRINEPFTVLVAESENGEAEERRNETAIMAGLNTSTEIIGPHYRRVSFNDEISLDTDEGVDLLCAAARFAHEETDRAVLLILDHVGVLSTTEDWGPTIKAVNARLLRALHQHPFLTVMLIVHLVKPLRDAPQGRTRSLGEAMGWWTRSCASVAMLSDLGGERLRLDLHKRVPRSSWILARENGLWKAVAKPGDKSGTGTMIPDADLLDLIEREGSVTCKVAAELLEASKSTVERSIKALIAQRRVIELDERGPRGTKRYALDTTWRATDEDAVIEAMYQDMLRADEAA
jgi:hypothetical protein